MYIKAELNYLHIAPRKVRLVTDLVKSMSVERARLELAHLPKRSSGPLLKLLQSAVANAKHNFHVDEKGLYLKKITVNPGPVLKRFEPRAFGRAAPIRRRASHISLILEAKEAKAPARGRSRREGPLVREMTAEDMGEGTITHPKADRSSAETAPKPRTPGFVRRVFSRKAI